ncbi:MAG: DNA-directed RNA polymerase subunit H, partial [Thermoprotei archaeon]
PKHELLSKEESERLLKEFGVKGWQLPRIAQDDPAVRDLNPETGQIVKITRQSQLTGSYVVYRIVSQAIGLKAPAEAPVVKEKKAKEPKKPKRSTSKPSPKKTSTAAPKTQRKKK